MISFYGADLASIHAEGFEALAVSAAETLLAHFQPQVTGRVLDLGCGAGPLSQRMSAHGFSVWGVDVSAALVRRARERLPNAEFVCGSVLDVALPDGSAAAAIGEVLNYATADQPNVLARVFASVFAALTPGGVFLFDLAGPGRGGVRRTFFEGEGWAVGMNASERDDLLVRKITAFRKMESGDWRRSFEEHHLRLWSAPDVTAQLVAAGFNVDLLDSYGGSNMPPALQVYLARKPS